MKTKVTYPKTDQPVRVESKYWTISIETPLKVLLVSDYNYKPSANLMDEWVRDARSSLVYGVRSVWLNHYQVLTNGDIWVRKQLQATITKDE